MKDSARYPIWFGRAWVFVHEHMKKNPGKEMSHAVLNVFTAKMVQRMFIDEDMVFQLIVISLGAQFIICVFFNLKLRWVNNRFQSQELCPTFLRQENGEKSITTVGEHDEDPGWGGMRLLEPPSRINIKEALAKKREAVEEAQKSQQKKAKQTMEKKRAAPIPKTKDWGYSFLFDTLFKYSSFDLR